VALDEFNIRIDNVIEISVPDETIKKRVSGRRVCEGCGASYHVEFKPSKVEGVCDKCGAATIIRKDDQPETVIERLKTYHEKTAPLKDYYEKQGKLVTVVGQEEVAETSKLTLAAVGA
jgi:adenylate kinase